MHRINATGGGWNQSNGLFFLEQTSAPLIFITAADTDIQTLTCVVPQLPPEFPQLRVANLLQLQQQITIDAYAEQVLESAQVIVLRLLGGSGYWSYGLEVAQEIVSRYGTSLIVIPGDDGLDAGLMSKSTLAENIVYQIWRYFQEGGVENFINGLLFICDNCFSTKFNPLPPQIIPRVGLYSYQLSAVSSQHSVFSRGLAMLHPDLTTINPNNEHSQSLPRVGILFYRAHYLAGNTKVMDALCHAIAAQGLQPVPVYVSSLRENGVSQSLYDIFQPENDEHISVLLNTTSFSLARLETEIPEIELWEKLNVPVFQVICSGGFQEQWENSLQGLTPRDMAMNVVLPEVDGRIITRAVSFKSLQSRNDQLETDVVVYEPVSDRINFIAKLAANWVKLRQKPPENRRIALILANYPNTNGRLANGVGLDTPASCVEILKALKLAGYKLDDIPLDSDALIRSLTVGVTNDPESKDWKIVNQSLEITEYQEYFATLPQTIQDAIIERWGIVNKSEFHQSSIPISGIEFGNIFVGIQPSRGYDLDPSLNYHAPDLEPTHHYLAFYHWIRKCFSADAIIHVGKHGNLEWLPGKSVALSNTCYPEIAIGPTPHLYPFIVNDPGEGSQAKRRSQAVIIDHLTPPMTRAELYGALQQVENLIDEYYEAESLDPGRMSMIKKRIEEIVIQENLYKDLGIENREDLLLNSLDGYLCELKETQIRDGLHIFGQTPKDRQLRDLIVAISRIPNRHSIGITRAIAQDWNLEFDPLTTNLKTPFIPPKTLSVSPRLCVKIKSCHIVGDVIQLLEEEAAFLVGKIIEKEELTLNYKPLRECLQWIELKLLPALQNTPEEINNLLRGLEGKYIPSAASGAPTRGRPEVLPTGKNFYSVDIRALPTETAWDIGRKAADALIETYTQEHGEYPQTIGLSVWGTATMRTGGDDIAQALALIGVRPVWDGAARRVVDFEILPLSILGRPRVDVTLRISGFFRDAFPNLIDLFSQAVTAVANLDEPTEENPIALAVTQDTDLWIEQGLSLDDAVERSQYRVFGSQPGTYGTGIQGLINSQNWQSDEDLAQAYINWSSYAYSQGTGNPEQGTENIEVFKQRLAQMQIVLHNQDNREHDILDSDDYYQFQGGLTAAVRSLQGKNPKTYFGDNSNTSSPKIRQLQEEINRVYRSRVINPKWIAGVMRHGYKGAFEMAATVDFLFGYDATAQCVEDHIYQGIVEAYLEDPVVCEFIHDHNPWALRDIAERLLEANQRNLWENVDQQTLENLRNLVHQAEAAIESK
ncbi:cobaltochelatase subunit CobN [Anabaena sp. FACHB-1237]|uniref:cobaltochelatase subunit CobN n=1 Tax=Anabaena sp. FACHB-1237 TaxID=2692769 RepID=UPI0016815598|nr:cobaltochelatase subunit CobN [Anabaena sp. FACHB-1237]MBD2138245.1 cobaltochelatase subunit CobN [Anabaena sp. FACHB-1237]